MAQVLIEIDDANGNLTVLEINGDAADKFIKPGPHHIRRFVQDHVITVVDASPFCIVLRGIVFCWR